MKSTTLESASVKPRVAETTKSISRERVVGFDLLRFVAVLLVIWYHVGAAGSKFTTFHVPVLVIISVALAQTSRPMQDFAAKRASRILLPWLFWCLVFGVLDLVRRAAGVPSYLNGMSFFYGTAIHLWFLPFIFLVTVSCAYLRKAIGSVDLTRRVVIACVAATILVFTLVAMESRFSWWLLPAPCPQWLGALPAVIIGIVYVSVFSRRQPTTNESLAIILGSCLLAATAFVIAGKWSVSSFSFTALALFALSGMWSTNSDAPRWLVFLASITMGVYIVHPIFITAARIFIDRDWQGGVLHASIAIAFSVVAAVLITRTPLKSVV